MYNLIKFFSTRHLLTNVLFVAMLILSLFIWKSIGKEEMPEFASNWVRVNTVYPGAPAEDVELFVTKPLEEELKGVVGIEEVISTSSLSTSSIRIVIDDNYPHKEEVVNEIKDAVLRTNLPTEVRDIPNIRQFKSSEKAILDIGFYHKDFKVLTTEGRAQLQEQVLSFENQILALKEISSLTKSHYRKPELQVLVKPELKENFELSLTEILSQIQGNQIRVPVGSMQDKGESKVTALNELEDVDSLNRLILRGNYAGQNILLKDIATVKKGFERSTSIFKINGHEAIFVNVRKSISTDILKAQDSVMTFIRNFRKSQPDSPIGIVLMDDESYAVTNRLNIIGSNGLLGFVLIVVVLLFFLNIKSGLWVAMGIPFSMAFTLTIAHLMDYTVNNMTLAGIIIVLGIVVDDAIIIAENIARKRKEGLDSEQASIVGTYEMFKPILASIVTTCVAFVPLAFFEGFFGKLVAYIPLIVILMLIGSLIESLFILPAHIAGKTPFLEKYSQQSNKNWFDRYENIYQRFLRKLLDHRTFVVLFFILLLGTASYLFVSKMKYVMFPREESKEVVVKVKAPKGTVRSETAELIEPIELMAANDTKNVVAVRSSIALSRRGGAVKENEASILIELLPRDERETPLNELLAQWEEKSKSFNPDLEIKFLRGRWGHDSGSAVEIQIQENDDLKREAIANSLKASLEGYSFLKEVEIEDPLIKKEYIFKIQQQNLIRLNVDPNRLTTALRTFVEGSIAFSINKGEEEVDVRLSVPEEVKTDLKVLLNLRVENREGQLVPLSRLVEIIERQRPVNIRRTNYKRSTMIYADLKVGEIITPLEVASQLETSVFPTILKKYPSSILSFKGEIEDSRESQGEFINSIILVIIGIYLILVVMFNSLVKPLLIMSIIPFGLAGVVFILMAHSMSVFGFFAVIGTLGMIGVVVNDAIIMIDRLDQKIESDENLLDQIAVLCTTRLRPIIVTTLTTVVAILPTAYGVAGYDSMLAEMMLVMGHGLLFGTLITLILVPCISSYLHFNPKLLNANNHAKKDL
jgi:multidrug efflux pump subunit AcrB